MRQNELLPGKLSVKSNSKKDNKKRNKKQRDAFVEKNREMCHYKTKSKTYICCYRNMRSREKSFEPSSSKTASIELENISVDFM